jgi:hypothetical protein
MPSYGSHPLPGMPGGDPPFAPFGWGPQLGGDEEYPVGHGEPPRKVRIGLVVALLVICSVVVAGLIAVVANRGNDSPNSAPALPTASTQQVYQLAGIRGGGEPQTPRRS